MYLIEQNNNIVLLPKPSYVMLHFCLLLSLVKEAQKLRGINPNREST
jgi:hypothetical protein